MSEAYRFVYRGGSGEIVEKKSRFIATVVPVSTEDEALAFIEQTKKKYWDARHNCTAFTIGSRHQLTRCSDDGEPAGTAGRPMLDVLLKEDIHNAAIVVTRYFGGTLLGTGGLVRAYSGAVQEGLRQCTILERKDGLKLELHSDYTDIGKIQYLMGQRQIPTLSSSYTDSVALEALVPTEDVAAFCDAVTEATAGKTELIRGDVCPYALLDGQVLLLEAPAGDSSPGDSGSRHQ